MWISHIRTDAESPFGFGFIIRNASGDLIHAICDLGSAGSSDEAECQVYSWQPQYRGIIHQLKNVEIESDSKEL
ncbi:hypothetical protein FRX31_010311 [Thalictrum thalictroides]|uniref:Uncharacterized protein n=1 Tax=Thalictrum thalictroides TaxID=46969 RepID=A0A7J6WRT9_THATH|nr:hypothetical protein FRX31_010311 [Thalictrum thalictroides]